MPPSMSAYASDNSLRGSCPPASSSAASLPGSDSAWLRVANGLSDDASSLAAALLRPLHYCCTAKTTGPATGPATTTTTTPIPPANSRRVDPDSLAAKALVGWGESAQEFAREAALEASHLQDSTGPSAAQRKLDALRNAYSSPVDTERLDRIARASRDGLAGWGETASQLAADELADLDWQQRHPSAPRLESALAAAAEAVGKAEQEVASLNASSSWWWGGSCSTDESRAAAADRLERAREEYTRARKRLDEFLSRQFR
ncbi:hypothetical protein TBLA_0G02690 [Henningerozyma blattae CBS 6284]|uniref:Uncharacterized protein n=1 Tax=Henningerozyma blattae (strain ATCC 34711 / CBS 6284 / DSM 70876 / NBRC 10599 / NRRL Y-10934 / UCD 77-7) TaxID=1071380 RepID=I2H755_HENB6|nr:hypothetical protein TBLA_0G02690 [Tetrapisispora blattae CBS 6284]CCH62207.1 hypothetical protein TBLA_0G02690 [Tetrapisispora blattae CBS 6284]